MITEVPDEAYDTPKDSSTKLTFENTLMSYTKRDITKKFVQSIVYKLSPKDFVALLNDRPQAVLKLLSDDYKPYEPML